MTSVFQPPAFFKAAFFPEPVRTEPSVREQQWETGAGFFTGGETDKVSPEPRAAREDKTRKPEILCESGKPLRALVFFHNRPQNCVWISWIAQRGTRALPKTTAGPARISRKKLLQISPLGRADTCHLFFFGGPIAQAALQAQLQHSAAFYFTGIFAV